MEEGILIPLGFFAMVVAIVALPIYFRTKDRARLHETLKTAYEKGQPVPPDLVEALNRGTERPRPSPERDLRTGVVLIAVALAMVVLGLTIGQFEDDDAVYILSGAAAFPGFIGLAFLAFWAAKRSDPAAKLDR